MEEIHLFDFDGTLFRSPDEPPWWPAENGNFYVHQDSLGRPCVPDKPDDSWWVSSVVSAAQKSISDPKAVSVLCTGRPDGRAFRWRIPELLAQKGLAFDGVRLNRKSGVREHKMAVAAAYLKKFPNVRVVRMWDDTQKNLDAVEAVVTAVKVRFVPVLVRSVPKPAVCDLETYLGPDPWADDPASRVAARWLSATKIPPGLPLTAVTEQGVRFETGKAVEFKFLHGNEKAPDFGSRFQQDIEPAGYYVVHNEEPGDVRSRWTVETATLRNPLVLAFNSGEGGYDERSWKAVLAAAFKAKKTALSRKILSAGFDGIVTTERGGWTREIVLLKGPPRV